MVVSLLGRLGWSMVAVLIVLTFLTGLAPDDAPTAAVATPARADSTGSSYSGARPGGGLTKDGDRVTPETLARDVKLLKVSMGVVWTLIAAFLVFFMQAGFALVESGMTRAKNVGHTMAMNLMIFAVGMIGFWICGFAFGFGNYGGIAAFDGPAILTQSWHPFEINGRPFSLLGFKGFFLAGDANDASVLTFFLFQVVFMDTAATIPTGALAERWKFKAFVLYALFMSMILYPIYASWVWGAGWLADLGLSFGLGNGHVDFAGSSVVHMTGGLTALAGAIVLGPRIGKFTKDGRANPMPAHNIPMVVLGTLILAFGWFGFNAGNTLSATDLRIGSIAVCTVLAMAAGCSASLLYAWAVFGKPDPTIACNGLLAGAVAITAPCAYVDPMSAVLIGGLAGLIVIWSVLFVERALKVDDPVGAVSVHGVCGAFGCLCVGLFANGEYGVNLNGVAGVAPKGVFHGGGTGQLVAQMIGVGVNLLYVFPTALLFFFVVDKVVGNRSSAKDEIQGLDVPEMGVLGYLNEDTQSVAIAGQEALSYGAKKPTGKGGRG